MPEDKKTVDFTNYADTDPLIFDTLNLLQDGPYINTQAYRTKIRLLKKAYMAAFTKDLTITQDTLETDLLPAPLGRIQVEVAMRLIKPPEFDIESYNKSFKSIEDRNNENVIKELLEVLQRMMGYEQAFRDGRESWMAYGDTYRRPFKRQSKKKKGQYMPGLEDIKGEDLMLDPTGRYIQSDSKAKESQFYAHTQIYSKSALVSKFGKWILDYAQAGAHIDSERIPTDTTSASVEDDSERSFIDSTTSINEEFYEVTEYQNKSSLIELVLVGSNAFPQTRIVENDDYDNPKAPHPGAIYGSKYPHLNTLGEPILQLYNNYCYLDVDSPYNNGIMQKVYSIQVAHQILENLKFDSFRKKNDPVPYIAGGRKDLMQAQTRQYRKDKKRDRDAFLHLPASLQGNIPITGLIEFKGYNPQEMEQATQDMYNLAKNSVGVNPQRQEVQKNTGVGQTEVIEEEKVDAMQEIVESNITNFQYEYRGILDYAIANKGFGLKDMLINYTKYEEEPNANGEGTFVNQNPNATISIVEATKIAENHAFEVVIDRSSLVKKSRFVENQKLTNMLGSIDPAASPGAFKKIGREIGKLMGLDLLDEDFGDLSQATAQGGASQFQPQAGAAPVDPNAQPPQVPNL